MKKKMNLFLCTSLLLSFVVLGACQTCYGAANSVELQVVSDQVSSDSDDTDLDDDEGYDDDDDVDDDDDEIIMVTTPTKPTALTKPTIQLEVSNDAIDEGLGDEDDVE